VTPNSRRIFVYWLLLLVAACGVGSGAWWFLRREEGRLEARTASAEASRRAAVEARARLVAENVELFVGDVEAGLLETLVEMPEATLENALDEWERANPLVRTTFRCTADGSLLRPSATASGDIAKGFRRRFASQLADRPPWRFNREASPSLALPRSVSAEQKAKEAEAKFKKESVYNKDAAAQMNTAKVQSARKEVQQIARAKSAPSSSNRYRDESSLAGSAADAQAAPAPMQEAVMAPVAERRGWLPLISNGHLHLLGWVQPNEGGAVRGVEIETAALLSRLSGAMPEELAGDEGYALLDEKGRIVHQVGKVISGGQASARISLGEALLPGWQIAAFLTMEPIENGGRSFFAFGLLLAGILVVAIVAGGSLLLWQARSSAEDAAQKTSFVANVSHEFKTPLTTIRLYSELLEQGRVAEAEKRSEYLRIIGRETQRLARLVNNVLDFSRLEQGRKKYSCEDAKLGELVAKLLDAQMPRLREANLELHRELPESEICVTTDRDAVEQVLLNLIDNACKYGAQGGELLVAVVQRGQGAVIRVADRGPGVPAAHRERIFEKFHRVDETLTAEKAGAGLGLSIARQLARGLGGDLRYQPREGGGAEFIFELP
jgi:signal transduction histidine kinase